MKYKFKFNGNTWHVKLEETDMGNELFYSIIKKMTADLLPFARVGESAFPVRPAIGGKFSGIIRYMQIYQQ